MCAVSGLGVVRAGSLVWLTVTPKQNDNIITSSCAFLAPTSQMYGGPKLSK